MSALEELNQKMVVCQACDLCRSRTHVVPGEGPEHPEILFIGEGPGFHEDQQGRPFVGPSGQLLERFLASIGLTRSQVFIANVVKCRPENNRDPLPSEIETCCGLYLDRQIELLDPRLVATLGRYSMERFFPQAKITRVHGRAKREGSRVYLPLYHPAYILRNQAAMPEAEADFKKIPRLLARLYEVLEQEASQGAAEEAPDTPGKESPPDDEEPKQLRLF